MPWKKIKFIRQFSGQLACTLTRISLFTLSMRVDKAGLQFYFFLFPFFNSRQFLRQCCRQSFDVYLKRTKKTVERTCSPWIFLARTNSQEIVVAKFEGEIIRLKELCTHMEIMVERLRRRPLFLYNKVSSK